jgi:hypothetical protein
VKAQHTLQALQDLTAVNSLSSSLKVERWKTFQVKAKESFNLKADKRLKVKAEESFKVKKV